jgi:hypothetical protein
VRIIHTITDTNSSSSSNSSPSSSSSSSSRSSSRSSSSSSSSSGDSSVSAPDADLSGTMVMLRFSLDGPVGPSGDVLPLLSLPAAVLPSAEGAGSSGCAAWCAPKQSAAPPDVADGTLPPEYAEFSQKCSRVHATCVREMTLPTGTTTTETATPGLCVYALESPGYLGIAGKVWDSMYVLLQYLSQHTDRLVRGKRIVELGCGTGLAGTSSVPLLVVADVISDCVPVLTLQAYRCAPWSRSASRSQI